MLINYKAIAEFNDPILRMIAEVNGNKPGVRTIQAGIYQIGSFGGSGVLRDFEHYPDFEPIGDGPYRGSYGVCDSVEQLLAYYPELEAPGREFVVTITEVRRENQDPTGGWRWHKWGDYIGDYTPKHEYLYDETIDAVYVYHIYEKK